VGTGAEPAAGWVDTGERSAPEGRAEGPRAQLTAMLDWYRAGVVLKVTGLDAVHAATSPVRTGTTIIGVVKHLALVEDSWCTVRFAGLAMPEPWASAPFDDDPDWEWHSARGDDLPAVVGLYQQACARSRAAVAGKDLDAPAIADEGRPFTLTWALLHLVEETARHLGQMDVLRELLDGAVGE
jgi:uncharacterized damage-inducible protein DinB